MSTDTHVRPSWICTASGVQFHLLRPRAEDVRLLDIAHALACTCRFGGHVREPYSVAQHSVLVSRLVSPPAAMWGLLHDAAEAYIGDVVRPLKAELPEYRAIEQRLEEVIRLALACPITPAIAEEVRYADGLALQAEQRDLMPDTDWWPKAVVPDVERIEPWPWKVARRMFLGRFAELQLEGVTT